MILFIISLLMVFVSSYLFASVITPKKSILGFIYLFLIAFAQLVLTFEVLSLFSAIKEVWVLSANILVLIGSVYTWNSQSRPIWSLDFTTFKLRVNNSLKLDKSLMWLYVGFLIFLISAFILCAIMPVTSADGRVYHVARCLFWIEQGNLLHFDTADVRNLCLPINSEILYTWVLLFIKKDAFLSFFSFVGYLVSIVSVYNILGYLGYCTRKKLWVVFILSSFPSVLVQASGTETDIIVAGLISSSIFLFWYALKNDKKIPVFMSSLAYALAMGTKTTALIAMPGVGLFLLALCYSFKKYKPFGLFCGFVAINFMIFSSYNYILNFIQFSDFFTSSSFVLVSKNYSGIKAIPANLIKYLFMFIDSTGFKWGIYYAQPLQDFRNELLNAMNLGIVKDGLYTVLLRGELKEPMMGAGVLGFLVFLPCLFSSFVKPIFKPKSRKVWFVFAFAVLFLLNLISISYLLAYMSYSVRFIMSFIVLSAPVLIYSYRKKFGFLKFLIIFFALYSLIVISTHLWARPLAKIGKVFRETHSISEIRLRGECKDFEKDTFYLNFVCVLRNKLKDNFSKENRILAFLDDDESYLSLKILEFDGYKIDFKTLEDANNINFDNYNLIISPSTGQTSTLVKYYDKRKSEVSFRGNKMIISNQSLVPCFYDSNPKLAMLGENKPYRVVCSMSKQFIDQHNMKMVEEVTIINTERRETTSYHVYQNANLPLLLNYARP